MGPADLLFPEAREYPVLQWLMERGLGVRALARNPEYQLVLVADTSNVLHRWDTDTWDYQPLFTMPFDVHDIDWLRDGQTAIIIGAGGQMWKYEEATRQVYPLGQSTHEVEYVTIVERIASPPMAITIGREGTIEQLDLTPAIKPGPVQVPIFPQPITTPIAPVAGRRRKITYGDRARTVAKPAGGAVEIIPNQDGVIVESIFIRVSRADTEIAIQGGQVKWVQTVQELIDRGLTDARVTDRPVAMSITAPVFTLWAHFPGGYYFPKLKITVANPALAITYSYELTLLEG